MNTFEKSLEKLLADLGSIFHPDRVFLIILFLFGIVGIILFNTGVFPLSITYLLFYLTLLILFGLYRPTYVWQLLVFFLPFEILSVGTLVGSIDIRAYQFGIVALGVATAVLWIQKKVLLPTVRWFDMALGLLLVGGVFTLLLRGLLISNSKDIIILFSFAGLYILGRVYLRTKKDIRTFLGTILMSGVVVSGYALYQMIAFQNNWSHFAVMDGRPNSTLEEADWLGFFMGMVGLMALVGVLSVKRWYHELIFGALLLLFTIVLILTVSRSAWLAFAGGLIVLGALFAFEYLSGFLHARRKDVRILLKLFVGVPVVLVLALSTISLFSLTRFELDERLTSTGTGEQIITIACKEGSSHPTKVNDIAELLAYGCQHINLEEQASYQQQGYVIAEVERPDPNIHIRASLYQQTWTILQDNFFLGIGWGESVKAFGTDGRGAGLNSSNLFLEIWLGSGLIGLLGFLVFWFGILYALVKRLIHKREITEGFWITVLTLLLWIQVTIFNFFNAGLLSGIFIAFLILAAWYGEKTMPHTLKSLWQK